MNSFRTNSNGGSVQSTSVTVSTSDPIEASLSKLVGPFSLTTRPTTTAALYPMPPGVCAIWSTVLVTGTWPTGTLGAPTTKVTERV